jgi:hypothetical protein
MKPIDFKPFRLHEQYNGSFDSLRKGAQGWITT